MLQGACRASTEEAKVGAINAIYRNEAYTLAVVLYARDASAAMNVKDVPARLTNRRRDPGDKA